MQEVSDSILRRVPTAHLGVACSGTEASLAECPLYGAAAAGRIVYRPCRHQFDVRLTCSNGPTDRTVTLQPPHTLRSTCENSDHTHSPCTVTYHSYNINMALVACQLGCNMSTGRMAALRVSAYLPAAVAYTGGDRCPAMPRDAKAQHTQEQTVPLRAAAKGIHRYLRHTPIATYELHCKIEAEDELRNSLQRNSACKPQRPTTGSGAHGTSLHWEPAAPGDRGTERFTTDGRPAIRDDCGKGGMD